MAFPMRFSRSRPASLKRYQVEECARKQCNPKTQNPEPKTLTAAAA